MTHTPIISTGEKDTRSGFGAGLLELGQQYADVVALCADLTGSLKMDAFEKAFPDRFFQCGISEANMIGVAAGLAITGKVAFAGTFANFATGRVYDQIRQSVAYSHKNVKICASHAGLTLGEDGATHQILEDVGLMRMLPGMTVVVPCDYNQTRLATKAIYDIDGPAYLRFGRPKWPIFTPAEDPGFIVGKAQILQPGTDITFVANGHMVWQCVLAAQQLAQEGISVELINLHTVKPVDADAILTSAAKTRAVLTADEHQIHGGLADLVGQLLSRHLPTPLEAVAVQDSFGESGTPDELLAKYGLAPANIVAAARKLLARKG
ncbi:MAG: transketolase family protein [Bacteroidetes bacterium]|nr:transketolase family protein [Bacteroidota bacterium]